MTDLTGKRIIIRVDGSHAIGLGHIFRMRTLGLALKDAGSFVVFLTKVDEAANMILRTTGLPCYIFHSDSYNSILSEVINSKTPDLIIQDILKTSSQSMKYLRQRSPAKLINFDDVGAGLVMADAVINSMVFHWPEYNIKDKQTQLFEGPQYMILQSEISKYVQLPHNMRSRAENVLLAFGGTDTHYVTERAIQAINNIETFLRIKINLGPGSNLTYALEHAVKESVHKIEVMYSVSNLIKEFHQTDLVLCAGGTMLYELAALGVPSVSIATEYHEIHNINYWSKVGTTVSLGWEKTLDFAQIYKIVEKILYDKQKRIQMSKIGKQTVDDLGIKRILEIIAEILK